MNRSITRRVFVENLAASAALGAAGLPGSLGAPATVSAASETPEKVCLESWKLVELPELTTRSGKDGRKMALRITAANGAFGVMPARLCRGFSDTTVQILKTTNLLDHKRLYDSMVQKGAPADQLRSADVLCWDLHARMSIQTPGGVAGRRLTGKCRSRGRMLSVDLAT